MLNGRTFDMAPIPGLLRHHFRDGPMLDRRLGPGFLRVTTARPEDNGPGRPRTGGAGAWGQGASP